jgi:hypothetical protein
VWTVGLAGRVADDYDAMIFTGAIAVVLGAEGRVCGGWSASDAISWRRFPMHGHVGADTSSSRAGVSSFERAGSGPARIGGGE